MSLTSLPSELLDKIILLTLPDGIESLLLSCKQIYEVARFRIPRHIVLKRKWRQFSHRGDIQMVSEFLTAVADDPLALEYIEEVDLWNREDISAWDDWDDIDYSQAIENQQAVIKRLVSESTYFDEPEKVSERWIQLIQNEPSEPFMNEFTVEILLTAFLLTLLPNVRQLTLPRYWREIEQRGGHISEKSYEDLWQLLDLLTHRANARLNSDTPLSKLERILPHANTSYSQGRGVDGRNGLGDLMPFMAIQSVKELYTRNCIAVDDGTGIPFEWRYPNLKSNLRKIELFGCCIDADGVREILEHAPQVTSFTYSHDTKWRGCQYDWDAGAFVKAIGQQVGASLTDLVVTVDNLEGEIERGVHSMKEFVVLKNLRIDNCIFNAPPPEVDERLGRTGPQPADWNVTKVARLVDILPSSIEKVDFAEIGKIDIEVERRLFSGFSENRSTVFPRLQHIRKWGAFLFHLLEKAVDSNSSQVKLFAMERTKESLDF